MASITDGKWLRIANKSISSFNLRKFIKKCPLEIVDKILHYVFGFFKNDYLIDEYDMFSLTYEGTLLEYPSNLYNFISEPNPFGNNLFVYPENHIRFLETDENGYLLLERYSIRAKMVDGRYNYYAVYEQLFDESDNWWWKSPEVIETLVNIDNNYNLPLQHSVIEYKQLSNDLITAMSQIAKISQNSVRHGKYNKYKNRNMPSRSIPLDANGKWLRISQDDEVKKIPCNPKKQNQKRILQNNKKTSKFFKECPSIVIEIMLQYLFGFSDLYGIHCRKPEFKTVTCEGILIEYPCNFNGFLREPNPYGNNIFKCPDDYVKFDNNGQYGYLLLERYLLSVEVKDNQNHYYVVHEEVWDPTGDRWYHGACFCPCCRARDDRLQYKHTHKYIGTSLASTIGRLTKMDELNKLYNIKLAQHKVTNNYSSLLRSKFF
jgi:hypothetical protein